MVVLLFTQLIRWLCFDAEMATTKTYCLYSVDGVDMFMHCGYTAIPWQHGAHVLLAHVVHVHVCTLSGGENCVNISEHICYTGMVYATCQGSGRGQPGQRLTFLREMRA